MVSATGTDLVHVPYKSAPQGVLAVMANEVTMGFFNTPMVIGQIKDGKLKALGVTSLERSPLLPSVPTLDEQGVKGYEVNTWAGFVAPAGTPPEIVGRLNAELIKIFASAEIEGKARVARTRAVPALDAGCVHQADRRRSDPLGAGGEGFWCEGGLIGVRCRASSETVCLSPGQRRGASAEVNDSRLRRPVCLRPEPRGRTSMRRAGCHRDR